MCVQQKPTLCEISVTLRGTSPASGLTVVADKETASAISQKGKQPRDLTEQGLSEELKDLRTLISLFHQPSPQKS